MNAINATEKFRNSHTARAESQPGPRVAESKECAENSWSRGARAGAARELSQLVMALGQKIIDKFATIVDRDGAMLNS